MIIPRAISNKDLQFRSAVPFWWGEWATLNSCRIRLLTRVFSNSCEINSPPLSERDFVMMTQPVRTEWYHTRTSRTKVPINSHKCYVTFVMMTQPVRTERYHTRTSRTKVRINSQYYFKYTIWLRSVSLRKEQEFTSDFLLNSRIF